MQASLPLVVLHKFELIFGKLGDLVKLSNAAGDERHINKTGCPMSQDWIDNELKTVHLEDQRLNHRFSAILKALSEKPNVSIPAACGGHTETIAAYRFFDNDHTTFEKILQPHQEATERRVAAQEVVLCVQDTTELDLTRPKQQIRGAGLIGSGDKRFVGYLHLLEVFVPDGTPLGVLWAKNVIHASEKLPKDDKTPK